eukprot:COSAG02_NODE_15746_length_1144_cov_1.266029_2_plen_76_part_01
MVPQSSDYDESHKRGFLQSPPAVILRATGLPIPFESLGRRTQQSFPCIVAPPPLDHQQTTPRRSQTLQSAALQVGP